MKSEWKHTKVGEKSLPLYVAEPDRKPGKAMIVFQEAFGVNGHIQAVTRRFASMGYLAVSPDLYYRSGERMVAGYNEFDKVMPLMQAMTDDGFVRDMDSLINVFLQNEYGIKIDDVGAVGYCMGGRCAFQTAVNFEIGAAVSYYGGRIASSGLLEKTKNITCPVLMFYGGMDKHIPMSEIDAVRESLRQNKVESEIIIYEKADHGFSCDERPSYNKEATDDSWKRVESFLRDNL